MEQVTSQGPGGPITSQNVQSIRQKLRWVVIGRVGPIVDVAGDKDTN